jgi:hypothetical protein
MFAVAERFIQCVRGHTFDSLWFGLGCVFTLYPEGAVSNLVR